MVTNYPQQLTASSMTGESGQAQDDSLLGRMVESMRQAFCSLRGHDSVLHFEQNKVMLRCTSCGHDSPGWDVGQARPRVVFEGDAERHLLRPEEMGLRRTA
ncbi:MAG: hypothetical protein HYU53_01670 [Acidobacteria bacterium]|nr:hypothetical protein [Acidobacteriota bacterium]